MTKRLIFTSKTYRWYPVIGQYLPGPGITRTVQRKGETRAQAQARTELMRQRTGKRVELQA